MNKKAFFAVDEQTAHHIKKIAKEHESTGDILANEILTDYISRSEKRKAFDQETIESWEDYVKTGLHVTQEEVERWMESWGTDNELPAPECHK